MAVYDTPYSAAAPPFLMPNIDPKSAVLFANQLRSARLAALADAEPFDGIIHVIERLGFYLSKGDIGDHGNWGSLGKYRRYLIDLTANPDKSSASIKPSKPFSKLYDLVADARNDALHQGAFARHLTEHAIELAIILEDALSRIMKPIVSDFMVQNLTCAELWQPVAFIRQQMLASSYSCLPVRRDDKWFLVSDASVAYFLGRNGTAGDRRKRLASTLLEASDSFDRPLGLQSAIVIDEELLVDEALKYFSGSNESPSGTQRQPLLLVSRSLPSSPELAEPNPKNQTVIVGIITAFDLL